MCASDGHDDGADLSIGISIILNLLWLLTLKVISMTFDPGHGEEFSNDSTTKWYF